LKKAPFVVEETIFIDGYKAKELWERAPTAEINVVKN